MTLIARITILVLLISFAHGAVADSNPRLLKTGPNVFQSADGTLQVVSALEGIFVRFGKPISPQLFDPATIPSDGTSVSVWLGFNPKLGIFDVLNVQQRRYAINGSFSIRLSDQALIGIDQSDKVGYVTVSIGRAVVAFLATDPVVLSDDLAPIVAAHQMKQYAGVIHPYDLTPDGLSFQGAPLAAKSVGLSLARPKNGCLDDQEVVLVREEELSPIRKLSSAVDRRQRLAALLEQRKKQPWGLIRGQSLVLSVTADAVTVVQLADGQPLHITPLKRSAKAEGPLVCVVQKLKL